MGNGELVDSMIDDGLWCAFDAVHMGAGTERYTGEIGGITREMQDEFAAKSHERAAAAIKEGRFAEEIAPIEIPQRKGDPVLVDTDEGVRPGTTAESLGKPPARVRATTARSPRATRRRSPTAAPRSSSRACEGRGALGLTPARRARELRHGRRPRPVAAHAAVARDQARARQGRPAGHRPRPRSRSTRRSRRSALASMQDLGITDDIVNVNGGAIALGHPIGMSGARVVLTLINELRRRGGGLGAAALCGGGGQGEAAIVRSAVSAPRRVRRIARALEHSPVACRGCRHRWGSRSRPARCGGPAPRCSRSPSRNRWSRTVRAACRVRCAA